MFEPNPLMLADFYKVNHADMYPEDLEYAVAYFRARKSRIDDVENTVHFGTQYVVKKWFVEFFNEKFFKLNKDELEELIKDFEVLIDTQMPGYNGPLTQSMNRWRDLHTLGYLPLRICSVPEGSINAIGTPVIEILNTVPGYAWIVNYFETLFSTESWFMITVATLAHKLRKNTQPFFDRTCDGNVSLATTTSAFGMRGQGSFWSGLMGDAAFLTSFNKSSNMSVNQFLEHYYNVSVHDTSIGMGSVSTEHSVMGMVPRQEERNLYERLLKDKRFNGNMSIVSDTWDFWKVVTTTVPNLKNVIECREGKFSIRPDSGDAYTIICGAKDFVRYNTLEEAISTTTLNLNAGYIELDNPYKTYIMVSNKYYELEYDKVDDTYTFAYLSPYDPTAKEFGIIEYLYNVFGGTINSKGFKVLNHKIGVIWGDGMLEESIVKILSKLESKGFAASNVGFGVGSWFQAQHSRDTLGFKYQISHAVFKNGKEHMVYKVTGNSSKVSLKGLVNVNIRRLGDWSDNNTLSTLEFKDMDHYISANPPFMNTIFVDGVMNDDTCLDEIRNRLWGDLF